MAALTINLQDVPPEGLRIALEVGEADLQFTERDPGVKDHLVLTAVVHAEASGVLAVDGGVSGLLVYECVRCLEPFDKPVDVPVAARYHDPAARRGGGSAEGDAVPGGSDGYSVVAQRIELLDMVREHIILAMPMQPLCSDRCRGLCHVCGRNLNVSVCGCEEAATESPFAVLRKVRLPPQNPPAV